LPDVTGTTKSHTRHENELALRNAGASTMQKWQERLNLLQEQTDLPLGQDDEI